MNLDGTDRAFIRGALQEALRTIPRSGPGKLAGFQSRSGGRYLLPNGPSVGTSVPSATSANTYGAWTTISSGETYPIYIVGITIAMETGNAESYTQVELGYGGTPTSLGEFYIPVLRDSGNAALVNSDYIPVDPWIRVEASQAIKARAADNSATSYNAAITLHVIYVDDVFKI